ncbi:TylF/MycF/NovP-related O-methyltransferase [Elioraea sp.]|uniref:TylF/MycF/NovP-related O-methyltransferase n=1 Tax=Elioraea sp. TaxID=2185103 RepID=UPI003F6F0D04
MTPLDQKAARLRERLSWKEGQLKEIHALYAEYVKAGQPFPADLEEHSLQLILRFVRPDDVEAARRLVTVLQVQNKPVPDDLRARAFGTPRGAPALDLDAVLAQIEAGVAERQTVMTMLSDLTARGESPPLPLEMAVLQHFIAEDPARMDLKRRLHTVLRLLGRPVSAELDAAVRESYLQEEYAVDYQQMLDAFASRVRFSDMEPEFFPLLETVRRFTMTTVERLYALWSAVRYLVEAEIAGDFLEAGVWRGGSVMLMAHELLRSGAADRTLWLYDTFSGLPRPNAEIDVDVLGNRAIDGWQMRNLAGDTSVWAYADEAEVRANMAATGYPEALTRFVAGKVEQTIPATMPERIALLRIDTDWYDSYRHLLRTLYDRLVPGGVLLLDDYGHMLGAKRAVDEFRQERGIRQPLLRVDYSCRMMLKP